MLTGWDLVVLTNPATMLAGMDESLDLALNSGELSGISDISPPRGQHHPAMVANTDPTDMMQLSRDCDYFAFATRELNSSISESHTGT